MKWIQIIGVLGLSATTANAHGLGFFRSQPEAVAHALVNDSPLLVFFTGSDWSPLTHEMDVKVWEDPALAAHLNQHYPMLNADFPQRAKLQPQHREQLQKLAEQHNVRHFPTVLAFTHEMVEIGRLEYRGESAGEVGEKLDQWEVRFAQLAEAQRANPEKRDSEPAVAVAPPPSLSELRVGDVLPDLTFIGSDGNPLTLSGYKGKSLLFTFIFTRCPLPEYCPLLASKFIAIQKALSEDTAAPKNWCLLSISIDPKKDTPEVLSKYGAMHGADANQWQFATGDLGAISTLALRLGADFWADKDGMITHHLRTVLVGPDGRIRRIFSDNKWSPDDLAKELKSLAGQPPTSSN